MSKRVLMPFGWAVAVVLLHAAGPSVPAPSHLEEAIRQAERSPDSALAVLAAVAAWLVLGWLVLGWLAVLGGRTRGRLGRICRGAAGVLVPRVLRGVLEGGVGLSVVLSSAPALAASPSPAVSAVSVADGYPASLPSLDRQPTTDLQLAPVPAVPAPVLAPARTPGTDVATRGQLPAAGSEAVVRRGDCLWSVVARALGPTADDVAVARAWPQWYAANRAVIGADPDLLLPGQRLAAPDHTS